MASTTANVWRKGRPLPAAHFMPRFGEATRRQTAEEMIERARAFALAFGKVVDGNDR